MMVGKLCWPATTSFGQVYAGRVMISMWLANDFAQPSWTVQSLNRQSVCCQRTKEMNNHSLLQQQPLKPPAIGLLTGSGYLRPCLIRHQRDIRYVCCLFLPLLTLKPKPAFSSPTLCIHSGMPNIPPTGVGFCSMD